VLLNFLHNIQGHYSGSLIGHNFIHDLLFANGTPEATLTNGDFVTRLQHALNARQGTNGAFYQRDFLLSMVSDSLAPLPFNTDLGGQADSVSTLTPHDGEVTAQNPRGLADALPDIGHMNLEAATIPPAAAVNDSSDGFAGGYALS
jgi:hypothetical protein